MARDSRRNDRLAQAMRDAGVGCRELAAAVGVHYKSAQRWLYEGRRPQTRRKVAVVGQLLHVDPAWLWPDLSRKLSTPELVHMYSKLDDVPRLLWLGLAESAREVVEIAGNCMPILPTDGLAEALESRAAEGVSVRLCVGESQRMIRIRGVQSRRCTRTDMVSIYRFDSAMLVWLNRGGPGMERLGPVLHLNRAEEEGPFDCYEFVFRSLWAQSTLVIG